LTKRTHKANSKHKLMRKVTR